MQFEGTLRWFSLVPISLVPLFPGFLPLASDHRSLCRGSHTATPARAGTPERVGAGSLELPTQTNLAEHLLCTATPQPNHQPNLPFTLSPTPFNDFSYLCFLQTAILPCLVPPASWHIPSEIVRLPPISPISLYSSTPLSCRASPSRPPLTSHPYL